MIRLLCVSLRRYSNIKYITNDGDQPHAIHVNTPRICVPDVCPGAQCARSTSDADITLPPYPPRNAQRRRRRPFTTTMHNARAPNSRRHRRHQYAQTTDAPIQHTRADQRRRNINSCASTPTPASTQSGTPQTTTTPLDDNDAHMRPLDDTHALLIRRARAAIHDAATGALARTLSTRNNARASTAGRQWAHHPGHDRTRADGSARLSTTTTRAHTLPSR